MAFQSNELMMARLFVVDEPNTRNPRVSPPPPPLVAGVHLRWALSPSLGFPWGGFYLYRRTHKAAPAPLRFSPPEPAGTPLLRDAATLIATPVFPGKAPGVAHVRSNRHLDIAPSPLGGPEKGYRLDGASHIRVELLQTAGSAHRVDVSLVTPFPRDFVVVALAGELPVASTLLTGAPGAVTATLFADSITAIEIVPRDPAAKALAPGILVEVASYEVIEALGQSQPGDWTALTREPIRLPASHPAYHASGGKPESINDARSLLATRVRYGKLNDTLPPPGSAVSDGTVAIISGSPLVKGTGTNWTSALEGHLLEISGDSSAYVIAAVLGPDRLVLSRSPAGPSGSAHPYRIRKDVFGVLYDRCVSLVRGGPLGPAMADVVGPAAIPTTGKVDLVQNSATVHGTGTAFSDLHEGLELYGVAAQLGTINVTPGRNFVVGDALAASFWSRDAVRGTRLFVDGVPTPHSVVDVEGNRLLLDSPYAGRRTLSSAHYRLVEPVGYVVERVVSATEIEISPAYRGATHHNKTFLLRPQGRATSGVAAPSMPTDKPLELLLLAALHPAIAQALGLYFVDDLPHLMPRTQYDYLLLADMHGDYADANAAISAFHTAVAKRNLSNWTGVVVFDVGDASAYEPLLPPSDVRVYELPGTSKKEGAAHVEDCNAGLYWRDMASGVEARLPQRSILYHVWRTARADTVPTKPPPESDYEVLTAGAPLFTAPSALPNGSVPPRPSRWPPLRLDYFDRALPEGVYSYRVHGIDIFGRHSSLSEPFRWHQWSPPPEPRPWYFSDAVKDGIVDAEGASFSVRLLDKVAPNAPAAVEATALDPSDPYLQHDTAYDTWYASLSDAEKADKRLVGLRLRFLWPEDAERNAPDMREFRVYFQPGHLNSMQGRITAVVPSTQTSKVTTDIKLAPTPGVDVFAGATLLIGGISYSVVGSNAASPLVLTVSNAGVSYAVGNVRVTFGSSTVHGDASTRWDPSFVGSRILIRGVETTEYVILAVRSQSELILSRRFSGTSSDRPLPYSIVQAPPPTGAVCSISRQAAYDTGRVTVRHGDNTVVGAETAWNASVLGGVFRVHADGTPYKVARVNGPESIELDRPYEGINQNTCPYSIRLAGAVDFTRGESWSQRIHVVPKRAPHAIVKDETGRMYRFYEVFLPEPGSTIREFLPLVTSASEPVAYGSIGVSAADDKNHTADASRWQTARLGKRTGNEGEVGAPARVYRVHRIPPEPPLAVPPPKERLFATSADVNALSFYTFRFVPQANLRAHVVRALDETLFMVDWSWRVTMRRDIGNSDAAFPADFEPERRDLISTALNALNDVTKFPADQRGKALMYYRSLTDDALRVLAALPDNESAYVQITVDPIDPGGSSEKAMLRDTLDGKSASRYFYRALFVDAANNRSALGPPSPPVWVPNVVPPKVPVLSGAVAAAERSITLTWSSNRELDLLRYHVFRAESAADARDLRTMKCVHTTAAVDLDPDKRPANVEWTDEGLIGGKTYHYRVTAEDTAGNISEGNEPMPARAYDLTPPSPPKPFSGAWRSDGEGITLTWTPAAGRDVDVMVLRRSPLGFWAPVSGWLGFGVTTHTDYTAPPDETTRYRLRVRSDAGHIVTSEIEAVVAAPVPPAPPVPVGG